MILIFDVRISMLGYQFQTSKYEHQASKRYFINCLLSRLFNVIKKAGSKTKLQIIAIKSVIETKIPNDCVPLKVDAVKMKKPVNKIIAV